MGRWPCIKLFQTCTHFLGERCIVRDGSSKEFVDEVKRVNFIALPMILVTLSQFILRLSPMFMLGHIDRLSLSSASIALSLANVTGFSVLFGMAAALETLCGQAYGAQQYKQVGTVTYGAICCLFLVCLPISLLWMHMDKLLTFIGQDPIVSTEAGNFAIWLIPSLLPYAILQCLVRYLQTQSLIKPMLLSSVVSLFFNLLLCWAFVFKLKLGNRGAALSIGLSYWLNVILLGIYVKYSMACRKTRAAFSIDVFRTMGQFVHFAVPSAMMVCLEWWSFEIIILFSGLLPNPQLEMSVLSICMTTTSLHYNLPYSFGAAASTRISNELGAGNPEAAKFAICVVLILSVAEFTIATIAIFFYRHILGYVFSDEKEVVIYVQEMAPLLCLSIIMDSLQAIFSGAARGSGWQKVGAYVNLGAYYLVGIPVALVGGFVFERRGKGLWIGLVAGATLQSFLFSLITILTDWGKQAMEARQRIFEGTIPAQIEMVLENEEEKLISSTSV